MKTTRAFLQLCVLGALLQQVATTEAQPVTKVSAGYYHSMFLKADGSLWVMGANYVNQLGDGGTNPTNRPEMIEPSNVVAIAAGSMHSLFLESDGSLWAMGYNGTGQLGDGTGLSRARPVQITNGVTAIAAGDAHSLFIKSDGSLWGMGYNFAGQLGDGTTNNRFSPVEIEPSGVLAIAAGGAQSHFLRKVAPTTTDLLAMGDNEFGELGDNSNTRQLSPEVITSHTMFSSLGSTITGLTDGDEDSFYMRLDGTLWATGNNGNGDLGNSLYGSSGAPLSTNQFEEVVGGSVTAVSAGSSHTLFLKSDGSLWGMGDDAFGQLGIGFYTNGINYPTNIVPRGVTAVSGGGLHTLFVRDGNLWATGDDNEGQLGDGISVQYYETNQPELIVIGTPGYNTLTGQISSNGAVVLSYVGLDGTNYALDRSFTLKPPVWVPQATNAAGAGGLLVFTNTPNPAANNFWRVRPVP